MSRRSRLILLLPLRHSIENALGFLQASLYLLWIEGGDFVFNLTNEASLDLDSTFVAMNGRDVKLEVAGQNLGLRPTDSANR